MMEVTFFHHTNGVEEISTTLINVTIIIHILLFIDNCQPLTICNVLGIHLKVMYL